VFVLVIGLVARLGSSKKNVNITTNDTVSNHTSLLQHKSSGDLLKLFVPIISWAIFGLLAMLAFYI
jgi:hypothetical protein